MSLLYCGAILFINAYIHEVIPNVEIPTYTSSLLTSQMDGQDPLKCVLEKKQNTENVKHMRLDHCLLFCIITQL
jgi:hypothetical protein